MTGDDLIKRAREQLATFNAKDWNRYRSLLSEDAIYEEEATHRRVTGRENTVKISKSWADAFPDARGTEIGVHVSGDTVILEVVWEGTHTGRLFGPMSGIVPTGKKAKVHAVQVIRFDGDQIAELRHYFDLMTILDQIGAIRPEQPAAP